MIIDGKEIAADVLARLKTFPRPKKFVAGVLVGNDKASESFQKIKERTANELGVDYRIYKFPEKISSDELRQEIGRIAAQKACGGIVLQLPLPEGINKQFVQNAIPPEKDLDVLGERAIGAFAVGRSKILPPAAATVAEIIERTKFDIASARSAVVGRGSLVGQPVATWLMRMARATMVLSRGSDFGSLKEVDLVVLGAGAPAIVRPDMLAPKAAVIDFGYAPGADGKLKGDLDLVGADALRWYTPTPGGTGPILVAKLYENFYLLNSSR